MSDPQKIKDAADAIVDILPDVAAAAGVESISSPTGEAMKTRRASEVIKDWGALKAMEAAQRNGGVPVIMVPRIHRA